MAITETPVHLVPNFEESLHVSNLAYSDFTINAASDKVAFIVQCPKDGTLDGFEWRAATVGNNPDNGLRCSFQDLDATTGLPDGTQDQYRDITGTISSNTWQNPGLITSDGTDGGSKRTVSSGEMLACVVEFVNFVASDSVSISAFSCLSSVVPGGCYIGNGTTGTYNKTTSALPNILLKYNDGTYGKFYLPIGPWSAVANTSFANSSTPDEIGMRLQVPIQCQVIGVWVRAAIANDADIVLYDNSDVAQRTVSIDKDNQYSLTARMRFYYFDPYTLAANTTHRIILKPTTTGGVTLGRLTIDSSSYLAALPTGAEWYETSRTDAGAWTDTNTNYPFMGLIVNGYETTTGGSSSGGSFTFVG